MNATQTEALEAIIATVKHSAIILAGCVILIMILNDLVNLYLHKSLVNKLDTLQKSIDELRADINKGQSVDALREELKDLKRRID